MELSEITVLVNCWNEEANIERCLQGLAWARRVLVLDSGSDDSTAEICARFSNVSMVNLPGLSFAEKCNAGLEQADSEWVLSIDADYRIRREFVAELGRLEPLGMAGFRAPFEFHVFGKPLGASLYPPRVVLYRRERARYLQDGHTQRVQIDGSTGTLFEKIVHDDRKSLPRWVNSQVAYAEQEALKLRKMPDEELDAADRLRKKVFVMPFVVLLITLFGKGVVWSGPPGWYYALQRFLAEVILSATLLDRRLRDET